MTWWLWEVLGVFLAAIELATPGGFFVIFFGVSAIIVGLLERAGLTGPAWVQSILFPIIALVALRLFRQPLMARLRTKGPDNVDSLRGEVAVATGDVAPGTHGRVELRGSAWSAKNIDIVPIRAGQRCRVVAVDGLTLDIRPE